MKKIIYKTLLSTFAMLGVLNLAYGQLGHVKISVDDPRVDWTMDVMTANFGPLIFDDITTQLAWVDDDGVTELTDGDTWVVSNYLACDTLLNGAELNGNIALISRGYCEFGVKSLNAEEEGALASIVGNRAPIGLDAGTHTNGLVWMGGGAVGDSVTIPTMFINYEDRWVLEKLLMEGPVTITIHQDYLYDAASADAFMTPIEQVDSMRNIKMVAVNLDTTELLDVEFTATIQEPGGGVVVLTELLDTMPSLPQITEGLSQEIQVIFEPPYVPTEVGEYTVTYAASVASGPHPIDEEVLTSTFHITEGNTMAIDNGTIAYTDGIEMQENAFVSDNVQGFYGVGSYYTTGPDGAIAAGMSFALANPDDVLAAGGGAPLDFMIKVFDVDPDGDGTLDSDASGGINFADIQGTEVVDMTYTLTGGVANQLIDVTFDTPPTLEPNHPYLVMVISSGVGGGFFVSPAYSVAGGHNTPTVGSVYSIGDPSDATLITFDADGFEDWNDADETALPTFPHGGRHPVVRLHLGDWVSTQEVPNLDIAAFELYPTLTQNEINVKMNLENRSDLMKVQIVDVNGKMLFAKVEYDVQDNTFTYDVSNLAAGTYFLSLQTKEGIGTRTFVVQ